MARNLDEIAPGISNVEKTLLFFFQDLFKCKEVNYKKAIDTFTATYLYSCKDICAEVQNNPRIGFVTAHYLKHMRRLRKRAFELIRQECELVDKLEDSNLSGNEKSKLEEQIIEIHEKLRDAIKEIYLYRNREFNCGIYNICDLLCQVDEDYDENELIWESIEEQNFDETYQFLDDKCNRLIWIHLGVSNYLIEENQRREKFYFNKHYDVVPDLHSAAVTQKRFQIIKKYRKYVPDTDSHLSDLLLHFDLSEVRRKNDIEKFFIALICIMKSYEYEDDFKEYAYILSDILQEIMFCGEIHKIYIQQKGVDKKCYAGGAGE